MGGLQGCLEEPGRGRRLEGLAYRERTKGLEGGLKGGLKEGSQGGPRATHNGGQACEDTRHARETCCRRKAMLAENTRCIRCDECHELHLICLPADIVSYVRSTCK